MFLFMLGLSGCGDPLKIYDYYIEGDFVFAYSKDEIETQRLSLYGLSEEGKNKEYLILPEEHKGRKIDGFGVVLSTFYGGTYYRDDFDSSTLKKIFVNFKFADVYNRYVGIDYLKERNKYSFIFWNYVSTGFLYGISSIIKEYIFGNNLINNEEMKEILDVYYFSSSSRLYYIANVSYIYNYEASPNDGYYWVDNYDSSLIQYIPPEPTREGYVFDGWYKEAECINKWDFNSDKTSASYVYYKEPDESSTEEYKEFYEEYINTHTYVETKLYAKWIKS